MSVVLARIDQRLIHGIVVTQWAGFTKAKRLMVVDDEISKDESQKVQVCLSLILIPLLPILQQGNMTVIMYF